MGLFGAKPVKAGYNHLEDERKPDREYFYVSEYLHQAGVHDSNLLVRRRAWKTFQSKAYYFTV